MKDRLSDKNSLNENLEIVCKHILDSFPLLIRCSEWFDQDNHIEEDYDQFIA